MSASVAIDFTAARQYLDTLASQGLRISVHHLVVASVARVLTEFPAANARVFGKKIVRKSEVGIAMPVNLIGFPGEARAEVTMAVMSAVDKLSLQELAARSVKDLQSTRSGKNEHPFTRLLFRFAELAPEAVFRQSLNQLDRISGSRLGPLFYSLAPVTAAVTNPGSAFGSSSGLWFRAGGVTLPQKLISVGTLWGISAVQEEVVPVNGKAEVRPILPVVLAFDHRLFDGVMAGKILVRFSQILQNPSAIFGEAGEKTSGSS